MPLSRWVQATWIVSAEPRAFEAVHEGDTDLYFGGLAVGISRGDALAERLKATNLTLGPASGVVSCPALPECPT